MTERTTDFFPEAPPPRGFFARHSGKFWCFSIVLALLWMGVIFFASTQLGSAGNTYEIVCDLAKWIHPGASPDTLVNINVVIRKLAHATEYSILSLLVSWVCLRSPWKWLRSYWLLVAILVVLLYSSSDEFHQTFVPDRDGTITDVMLDTGAGTAAALLLALWRRARRTRRE
jgi:VanZ family protein